MATQLTFDIPQTNTRKRKGRAPRVETDIMKLRNHMCRSFYPKVDGTLVVQLTKNNDTCSAKEGDFVFLNLASAFIKGYFCGFVSEKSSCIVLRDWAIERK